MLKKNTPCIMYVTFTSKDDAEKFRAHILGLGLTVAVNIDTIESMWKLQDVYTSGPQYQLEICTVSNYIDRITKFVNKSHSIEPYLCYTVEVSNVVSTWAEWIDKIS